MIGAIIAGSLSSGLVPETNSYESIATFTVGSGGSSSITFSLSGVSGYKHLQLRAFAQCNRATYGTDDIKLRFNSDSGSNYSYHALRGTGSGTPEATSGASQPQIMIVPGAGTGNGNTFCASIIDVLDYADTTKYKTVRALNGDDLNGTVAGYPGYIALSSGLWMNTAAITSIEMTINTGASFTQYSSFALYGIKG